jgi:uncharacterized membrane protein
MTETLLGPAGLSYLTDVGAALGDLAPAERDELLDEVHEHLAAIVAEVGHDFDRAALVARLGPPSRYAAELRAAAGLEPVPQRLESSESIWQAALRAPLVAATWAYVRRLEPAWWALRGYLIAGLLPWWFGVPGVASAGRGFVNAYVLHWNVDDEGLFTGRIRFFFLIPILAIVVLSVLVGLRAEHSTVRRRALSRTLDAIGLLALVLLPMWWIGPLLYDFTLHR